LHMVPPVVRCGRVMRGVRRYEPNRTMILLKGFSFGIFHAI
jgi:hypothetical protein